MASPSTLELRARMAVLQPRQVYLNRPARPKTMLRGDYTGLLRQKSRGANAHRAQRIVAVNAAGRDGTPRAIPVGGPGRRRAKAARNNAAERTAAAHRPESTA